MEERVLNDIFTSVRHEMKVNEQKRIVINRIVKFHSISDPNPIKLTAADNNLPDVFTANQCDY